MLHSSFYMEVVCLFVAEHDKLIWEPTTVVLKSAVIAIHNKACEIPTCFRRREIYTFNIFNPELNVPVKYADNYELFGLNELNWGRPPSPTRYTMTVFVYLLEL